MRVAAGFVSMLVLFLTASGAHGQQSVEPAKFGQIIWPAFQCSVAAEHMGDKIEQQRLFELGLERGRRFIQALADGMIDEYDVTSSVAVGTTMRLQGPNADFMLGRIWEAAIESYYDKLDERCGECVRGDKLRQIDAETQFRMMNCELLE